MKETITRILSNNTNAVIFGLAIVLASIFIGRAYVKRSNPDGTIQVTGLGKEDFISDLIVWDGRFEANNYNLKDAYNKIENDKAIVNNYLKNKGVKADEIVFNAINVVETQKSKYSSDGNYIGSEFNGYNLSQNFQIKSKEVDKIEKISREITDLLNQGLQFYSESPRYYYTKLSDLKLEMISKATEDARVRAENISMNSHSSLGDLKSAKMGIFQITGQNSDEDYSWGGTFNTESKEKTASITMKLEYSVK